MSNTSVFCIATSRSQAENITDRLKAAILSGTDISVLLPDKGPTRDFAHEMHTKAPEGATAGGVIGGALGWIAGIGALAIPGVGPFIAAGPVMVALSGAAVGAAVGGITGGLIGFGIPEIQAKCYEGQLKAGNVQIASTPRARWKSPGPKTSSTRPGRWTSAPQVRHPFPREASPANAHRRWPGLRSYHFPLASS